MDITDEQWLKSAVLFWDKVETIAPTSVGIPYSGGAYECWREGLVEPLRCDLHTDIIDEVSDGVVRALRRERTWLPHNDDTEGLIHADKMSMLLRSRFESTQIHPEKMSFLLQRELDQNLRPRGDGYVNVPSSLAAVYMTLLACSLAKKARSQPLTSNVRYCGFVLRDMIRDFGNENTLSNAHEGNSSALLTLTVDSIRIREDAGIQDVIRFRRRNSEQLHQFKRELEQYSAEIQSAENPAEATARAERIYTEVVAPSLRGLEREMKNVGLSCVADGLIKIATFSVPSAGFAALAGASAAAAFGLSAGLTLAGMGLKTYVDARRLKAASPYSYLMTAQRKFSAA